MSSTTKTHVSMQRMLHWNMKTRKRDTWGTRSAEKTKDTEVNMLSGITRKSNMRSTFCWFTESCNSQCLSHFAAPFIVVRAETSITGSYVVHTTASHQRKWQIIRWWKILSERWQANFADRNHQSHLPPLAMHVDVWTSGTWPQRYVHKHDIEMCEWSFRRFTYGNLVTTSPSSKWWGSLDFERHVLQSWTNQSPNYSPNHSIGRSDGRCVQRAGT